MKASAAAVSAVAAISLAACSSSSGSSGASGSKSAGAGAAGGTYTVWDPYPQLDDSSKWGQVVHTCGTSNGVTVKRTALDTTALTTKVLLAAQQKNAPNVLIVDNPVVSTLASAGILLDTGQTGQSTGAYAPNLLGAGQLDGKTYGVPIGANTLALWYNKTLMTSLGIDPASITDWTSLNGALSKAAAAGKKGITFSAIGTEEGSFQFEPWFWGSGAKLTDLSSTQAVSALKLWTDWVKQGIAPHSVLQDNQTASWQEFSTGNFLFGENGTWQTAQSGKLSFQTGVIPIPSSSGGLAPAPTGGEFVAVPKQSNSSKDATSGKIASCLASAQSALTTDTALGYISAIKSVQDQQVAQTPALQVWVAAVNSAQGRTADNLGTKYPKISEQLWTAVQAAVSGSKSPKSALSAAQAAGS
jgi:multiple sugar transport system substrate-binding protein